MKRGLHSQRRQYRQSQSALDPALYLICGQEHLVQTSYFRPRVDMHCDTVAAGGVSWRTHAIKLPISYKAAQLRTSPVGSTWQNT